MYLDRLTQSLLRARGWAHLLAFWALLGSAAKGAEDAVFRSDDVAFQAAIERSARPDDPALLRYVHVEERMGVARQRELVRAPVFFAQGECADPRALALVRVGEDGSEEIIPFQADDIRRGPGGGISRLHLWFEIDLHPWQKRRLRLVKGQNPGAALPAMETKLERGVLTIRTAGGSCVFVVEGKQAGAWQAWKTSAGDWQWAAPGLLPHVSLGRAASEAADVLSAETQPVQVQWGAGPLFTKLRLRFGTPGNGAWLEQEYRLDRQGREVIVSQAIFLPPEDKRGIAQNRLLTGKVGRAGDAPQRVAVPAGIIRDLRTVHAETIDAWTRPRASAALLAVPTAMGGNSVRLSQARDGEVTILAPGGKRGDEGEAKTLLAFWREVRLVPAAHTEVDALWETYRARVQPLVAIVDDPRWRREDLHEALRRIAREMKPIGWRQEAARFHVLGDAGGRQRTLQKAPRAGEDNPENWVRGAKGAQARITEQGSRAVKEHEKGRAAGGLDPYHITYTQSAVVGLAALGLVPEPTRAVGLAIARGSRAFSGRVDEAGSPYIDCFFRASNMQMGTMLFGLTEGKRVGDEALVRFARDLATAPARQAVYGRAQRPYAGRAQRQPEYSDFLYQAICDFWIRTAELTAGEDLGLHPAAYARYTDCIDVLADRYHRVDAQDHDQAAGVARANFFRGQAHTHRWLGWSCAPYFRLLEDPAENGEVGLTEAIAYTRLRHGRWINWPDLTFYLLADMLVRDLLPRAAPAPVLPARPGDVRVERRGQGNAVRWQAVPGAAGYRLYRVPAAGGAGLWLNSPYRQPAGQLLTETAFFDEDGAKTDRYWVTAVDDAGRESRWWRKDREATRVK